MKRITMGLTIAAAMTIAGMIAGCQPGAVAPEPTWTYGPTTGPDTTVPSPAAQPSHTAGPVHTTGWVSFVSDRHGYSLDLPPGWTFTPASADWPLGTYPVGGSPYTDALAGPGGSFPVIDIVSQPLAPDLSAEDFLAWLDVENARFCKVEETEVVVVDGVGGRLQRQTCGYNAWEVALIAEKRVTLIYWLGAPANRVEERAVLDAVLATFRFGASS